MMTCFINMWLEEPRRWKMFRIRIRDLLLHHYCQVKSFLPSTFSFASLFFVLLFILRINFWLTFFPCQIIVSSLKLWSNESGRGCKKQCVYREQLKSRWNHWLILGAAPFVTTFRTTCWITNVQWMALRSLVLVGAIWVRAKDGEKETGWVGSLCNKILSTSLCVLQSLVLNVMSKMLKGVNER